MKSGEFWKGIKAKVMVRQGTLNAMEIWVDKETGVNYVFHASGYAGEMTVLLNREGKPVVSTITSE